MSLIRHLGNQRDGTALAADSSADSLGGKGWNLEVLLAAGFPVPPAFCLTSAAHRAARRDESGAPVLDDPSRAAIVTAYKTLGGGRVAVRSSATVEDGAASSFAGLQETILGVVGEADLIAAVERCWRSIDSERARLYRQEHRIDESQVAMAVVVQQLVEAEVAGVLFTHDPLDAAGRAMLVEASWGLGEAVVSGRVTPDRFQIDRESGAVLSQQVSRKDVEITSEGERPVAAERQSAPCLTGEQLRLLAELGRRVEDYYGESRDIEWAWAAGQMWLLQARPITVAGAADRAEIRRQQIAQLAKLADPRGTAWAKYNLAEVLPAPTPMTWAIVRRFMSGRGGMGLMFRDLGFDPDPVFDELGYIDLVCGRPYVNLSREAKMHFRGIPYGHDFAALKAEPRKAMYPQPAVDQSQVGVALALRLPIYVFKMWRAAARIKAATRTLANRLTSQLYPQFAAAAAREELTDWQALTNQELLARLDHWIVGTLEAFARESLKPAAIAAAALARLEAGLASALGAEEAAIAARGLLSGVEPAAGADLAGALRGLAGGAISRDDFLRDYGHRGSREMELAEPRWREAPEQLVAMTPLGHAAPQSHLAASDIRWLEVAEAANLGDAQRATLALELQTVQTYMALREASKHYFMLGYALIRRALIEIGRRSRLGDGVFYLEPAELPRLLAGHAFSKLVAERRQRRKFLLSLEVPPVLFSDDLEAIGRKIEVSGAAELSGTAISAGVVEGPALVLTEPAAASNVPDGFVLVCPSTDPAWVPLFLRAAGLVMETGGVLSHGAIVAREFGLPAVAGIANVTSLVRTGQRVRVDGDNGAVHVFEE